MGTLDKPVTLENLARQIQQALGLDNLRFSGNPDLKVEKIALCSGSGSSLMKNFMASGAEVYVSGDLRYHDARDVEATGRGLVDIGHFASEHLMLDVLAERLRTVLADNGLEDAVEVDTCGLEKDRITSYNVCYTKLLRMKRRGTIRYILFFSLLTKIFQKLIL